MAFQRFFRSHTAVTQQLEDESFCKRPAKLRRQILSNCLMILFLLPPQGTESNQFSPAEIPCRKYFSNGNAGKSKIDRVVHCKTVVQFM